MQTCTECGKPLRQVSAGVSKKTGRPYEAFLACPDRHRQNSPSKPQGNQPQESGKQNAAVEMIYLLKEISDTLLRIEQRKEKEDIGNWEK